MIDVKYLERLADEATLDYFEKQSNVRLARTALRLCERECEEAAALVEPIVIKYLRAKLSASVAPAVEPAATTGKGEQGQ
jgi:hypothetical protein